ncbi:hypothetical protein AB670_02774 [Chryseobacterium sp. MOF25P]|uniref:hypothetical protein n=1 Tax=unclassified Chryseobacterium TaxID=2593645 RepID=UPI000804A053|nr:MULTISPECIES: hypothetical protein [unclassified Chryseobacterium]OBW40823.1 hypothetical protein AB670_02774 [Chryseobacterium sp. MOF25P]OBW45287.1 hypothetical protein AB671_02584 [Chryseobacterium sp. BGARF1]
MKKLLFLLTLISGFFFGQNVSHFENLDSLQFTDRIAEVVILTGRNYKLYDSGEYKKRKYFQFSNADNKEDTFTVTGYKAFVGGNPALEIKGKETWGLRSVAGPFLAVYPFWLKFIDPQADRDKIIKEGNAYTPKDRFTRMIKDGNSENYWIIQF